MVLNHARQIVPIALVATLHTTKEVYAQLFRTLFKALGGGPKVLVTDEEKAAVSAIAELQESGEFVGTHLLDGYHIVHNVRKRLTHK